MKFVLTFENGTRINCIQKQKEDIPKWMLPDECGSAAAHGRCREMRRKRDRPSRSPSERPSRAAAPLSAVDAACLSAALRYTLGNDPSMKEQPSASDI
ncbi:unnamed protein product [Rangifer tarandus platyrhynchus]|uniref:Uncharacterized protein n=1 Tax=Rangifer tarandus platyrhynchus TaxID=3082113 RepID=A0AC59ZW03_RANTA